MRNPKHIVIMSVALLCAMLPSLAAAQTRERFGISAKAGGVNNVVGRVRVTREEQQPQVLTSTDNLVAGETVTTASSSNAEILLNPGSYFRLGENSEFQFEDISLDNLRLRLMKGSAIIEATGDGYRIMDACGRDGWLAASDVDEGLVPIDRRTEFGDAVFVIDPGHGLPDLGAVGPNRVLEGQVNLKVAARLQALLEAPHDIDWATGTVTPGTAYPAVSSVILTRSPEGPNGGDYEMPLTFRSGRRWSS